MAKSDTETECLDGAETGSPAFPGRCRFGGVSGTELGLIKISFFLLFFSPFFEHDVSEFYLLMEQSS